MVTLDSLLYRGYFLRELPPAFMTEKFADAILNNPHSLPNELDSTSTLSANLFGHSVARLGITRRYMCIPNPIPYLRLCREIANNWSALESHCQQSPLSKSTPTDNPSNGRAIITISNFRELLEYRSHIRSTSKYIVRTDIAKFYPSIYTHSIPWALHGKTQSKANRWNMQFIGNVIDLCIRNCQDQQTNGIPIGPDTSLVISEIILSSADKDLLKKHPGLKGFRYVDDYEFGFQSYSEAEEVLALLQEILQSYELGMNFNKTTISELPITLDPLWVSELRNFQFRLKPNPQRNDLIHYFSKAVEIAKLNHDDFVLSYTIARLRGVNIDNSNWDIVQDFLFQCLMVEPGAFLKVLERLMEAHKNNYPINRNQLDEVMNFQLIHNSSTGRSSEVAWALWALIFWNVSLSKQAAESVSNMEDSVIALLALDAERRGLVPSGLDTTLWESFMTEQELLERQWLLAYEASIKNWLPSVQGIDYIALNPAFNFLRANNVEFYDSARLIAYRPAATSGAGVIAPQFSQI